LNPWSQQQRFDPQARYVKRWVPQLRELDVADIHRLHDGRPGGLRDHSYSIADQKQQFHKARQCYERARWLCLWFGNASDWVPALPANNLQADL